MKMEGWKIRLKQKFKAFNRSKHKGEQRFRRLFENMPEPVWIITGSHFVEVNPAALRAIGYTHRPNFLRLHPADVSPGYQPDGELSRSKAERMIQLAREEGVHRFEWVHKRQDESLFPVEVTLTPIDWLDEPSIYCTWYDIAERKRLETSLREKSDQLEAIFENANIGLALSENRMLIRANRALCDVLGYTAEELVGKSSSHLFSSEDAYQQAGTQEALSKLYSGEVVVSEIQLRHKHGDILWVRVAAKVVDPAASTMQIISMVEDITVQKSAELRNQQLLAIINDSSDLIAMTTPEGQLTYINPDGLKMVGIPEDTDPHSLVIPFFHKPETTEKVAQEVIPTILEKGHWSGELSFLHRQGHEFPASCSISAHKDESGKVVLFSNIARDISGEKQTQAALVAAKEAAEAATKAKSEFLAHMSHEIRTPMNAVLGMAQLLGQESLPPNQAEMVSHIVEAGGSLLRVINDILDFSKIEAGQIQINDHPFDLAALLMRVEHLFRSNAEQKGVAFTVSDHSEIRGALHGDHLRLEQILTNLVGNAIKFTSQGSVCLEVGCAEDNGHSVRLRFEVKDTGIGISPEVQAQLFKSFSQGDGSITRRFGGTGLGLSISKQLVELMGGHIGVFSEEGHGSTFWFEMPLTRYDVTQAQFVKASQKTEKHESPVSNLTGLRVLAVDDSRINLMILEKVLTKEGACVTLAADGQQALQILDARPDEFDVVLMDIQMPVMDGLTATRAIRSNPSMACLPVIALTAGVLPEERQAALDAGVNDFLTKPLDLPEMQRQLAKHVSVR